MTFGTGPIGDGRPEQDIFR